MGLSRQSSERAPGGWMPPGQRWGLGSNSVLPYLSHSQQSKMLVVSLSIREDGPVRNPVFPDMEHLPPKREH